MWTKVYRRRRFLQDPTTDLELQDEELDKQLLVCQFMVVQERECVRRADEKQLQRVRASRGVALAVDQGSALGVQTRRELGSQEWS